MKVKKILKFIFIIITFISIGKIYDYNIKNDTKAVDTSNIKVNSLLVNRYNGLDKKYIPEDLVEPNIEFAEESTSEERKVSKKMAEALEQLISDARKEGIYLLGNSGYRSYRYQKKLYNDRVKKDGKELADAYVAKPGYSEHQTGLAIDITNRQRYFVQGTIEAEWLKNNCYKYGFIIRYPQGKESITGINYEPWHIRYVGEEAAKYINNNNITLEEYLGEL